MIKRILTHPLFWVLMLAIPTVSTLFRPGYFPMHDDMQAMRLMQIDKCITDGQIPCRWVPDMGYGYGYPQFNYYGPLPYYFMEIIHLGGAGYLDSVKAGFVLSVVIAAAGMYLLGTTLWGRIGGLISSLLYVYAPYRAVDMYVRGAVGEFYALAILPFIFWAILVVFQKRKYGAFYFALSIASLLATHNVTTLIFTPVMALWFMFLWLTSKLSLKILWRDNVLQNLILGGFWGVGLAAFFFLPAYFEQSLVHVETLTQGYFNYLAHFVSVKQLLLSHFWGYGSSELGSNEELSFLVGLLHWTLPIAVLTMIVITKKFRALPTLLFFVIVGWSALFLTHQKSVVVWDSIPLLSYVQFPWRFLTIATFVFSVAGGACGIFLQKANHWKFLGVGLISVPLLLLHSHFFQPQSWYEITDQDKYSGNLWEKQLTISIFDYLPKSAEYPPSAKAPEKPYALEGEITISDFTKGTNWQAMTFTVVSESAIVVFPVYNFPKWELKENGTLIPISESGELGLVSATFANGQHKVNLELRDTPIRSLGNTLTLVSLIAISFYFRKKEL